ncbi:hypothetical protein [Halopelagius fulvigenes]|uniref:Uncharacterized protein n=1 Tax=Halopelagius fulvigenes TaxID=1198324 RepID=A0ABD5TYN1_9EURY
MALMTRFHRQVARLHRRIRTCPFWFLAIWIAAIIFEVGVLVGYAIGVVL